mmetsp:Transcript_14153/g.41526  ORF Transcript_14153/g.41526 Transcript_14153/m.41526 type:complete len:98 (+) Transcript_14153:685-978(+)
MFGFALSFVALCAMLSSHRRRRREMHTEWGSVLGNESAMQEFLENSYDGMSGGEVYHHHHHRNGDVYASYDDREHENNSKHPGGAGFYQESPVIQLD